VKNSTQWKQDTVETGLVSLRDDEDRDKTPEKGIKGLGLRKVSYDRWAPEEEEKRIKSRIFIVVEQTEEATPEEY
jgi:hypothetical protein